MDIMSDHVIQFVTENLFSVTNLARIKSVTAVKPIFMNDSFTFSNIEILECYIVKACWYKYDKGKGNHLADNPLGYLVLGFYVITVAK